MVMVQMTMVQMTMVTEMYNTFDGHKVVLMLLNKIFKS